MSRSTRCRPSGDGRAAARGIEATNRAGRGAALPLLLAAALLLGGCSAEREAGTAVCPTAPAAVTGIERERPPDGGGTAPEEPPAPEGESAAAGPSAPAQAGGAWEKAPQGTDAPSQAQKAPSQGGSSAGQPTPAPQPGPGPTPTPEPAPEPAPEPVKSYDIDYFVAYAKEYGQRIGLELDPDGNPDNRSWDTPITATFPITEQWKVDYKKQDIEGYCQHIKREGNTSYWVYAQKLTGGRYRLYIGY